MSIPNRESVLAELRARADKRGILEPLSSRDVEVLTGIGAPTLNLARRHKVLSAVKSRSGPSKGRWQHSFEQVADYLAFDGQSMATFDGHGRRQAESETTATANAA